MSALNLALHRHRVLCGGPQSHSALRHIFGITPEMVQRGYYDVTDVRWVEGAMRVVVVGAVFDSETLWLMPPETERAYFRTPGLALAYEGKSARFTRNLERLLQHLEQRLAPVDLPQLLQLLLDDPALQETFGDPHFGSQAHESAAEAGPASPPPGDSPSPPADPAAQGAPAPAPARPRLPGPWGEFFSDNAIQRSSTASLQFRLPILHIFHGTHECLFTSPGFKTRLVHLHNYPWARQRPIQALQEQRATATGDAPPPAPGRSERISSDMADIDVIMGAEERLVALTEEVLKRRTREVVSVHCSCLPMVMGEDLERATAALREGENANIPLFFTDQLTHDPMAVLSDMFVQARPPARETSASAAPADAPLSFNLIGFPDCVATGELVAVLETAGTRLNALLIPEVDFDAYRRAPAAAVQVFFDNTRHADLYRAAMRGLGPAEVTPPPPFGVLSTAGFFAAVAATFAGLGARAAASAGAIRAAAEAAEARVAPALARLRAETEGATVGFVVDERHIAKLFVPARCFGVPLMAMLRELGLGVHVFCFDAEEAAETPADPQASSTLPPYADGLPACGAPPAAAPHAFGAVQISRFRDRAGLLAELRSSGVRAVYSDFFFDTRLTSSGLSQFTMADFEMGFEGARRTFERLARRVRLPFYRRYARHLRSENP
jgi:hypothetical protein